MSNINSGRRDPHRLSTQIRLATAAVASCFVAVPAWANGENPVVVNGSASFNQVGKVLTVTNSNGAIINWDRFSIAAGETTRFQQAAASSSVMNRVLNDPTAIYGTLSSNGRVWLINPAGILVGPGGRVDTAGFVASTLNIRNEDFLAGRKLFSNDGNARDVINQGEIKTPAGGSVYLVGSSVRNESVDGVANSGIITTPQGESILAAGATVSLIDSATPGVKVDITGAAGNATNLGTITAEAGRIGIAGIIVRNSGTLNASSVVNAGGKIFLKASQRIEIDAAGRILADGSKGGEIVAKVEEAGEISGSLLARGEISAQGDGSHGSGGFVETSAAKVDLRGLKVNTRGGKWLIDPTDFTVAYGGDMSGSDLGAALEQNDVTIQSSAGSSGGNGDIFVNETVSLSDGASGHPATTLTLQAQRSIEINAPILGSYHALNVVLQARAGDGPVGNVGIFANIDTNGGNLWVGGGSTPGGTGYAIGYDSAHSWTRYGIAIDGATIITSGGDVTLRGQGLPNATGDADGIDLYNASASIDAGGGNIALYGIGGANPSGDTSGVYIGGTVETSGSGTIAIAGTGGSNSATNVANRGVRIDGGTVQAGNGTITITGNGGGGFSGGNVGILIDPESRIDASGSGSIFLYGVGGGGTGRNHGIYMDGGTEAGTKIASHGGNVQLLGTAGGRTDPEAIESFAVLVSGDASLDAPYGGSLTLASGGGSIVISPASESGNDYGYDPALSAGYRVDLTTHGDDVSWNSYGGLGSSNTYITTTGHDGDAGASGDTGGDVSLQSLNGSVTIGSIHADGGEGGSNGGHGGDGGSITLNGSSLYFGDLYAHGGDGGFGDAANGFAGGNGGAGGRISLTASTGDIDFGDRTLDVRGGDGGSGGESLSGHAATAGGRGGDGGSAVLHASGGNVTAGCGDGCRGEIDASGGQGGDGGNDTAGVAGGGGGGDGGDAGSIALTGQSILLGDDIVSVIASGGGGGDGGGGYSMGNGGTAIFTVRDADGQVVCGPGAAACTGLAVSGGWVGTLSTPSNGGDTGSTAGGNGGNGGNAGNMPDPNIKLVATDASGSGIQLYQGASVEAMGGQGGQGAQGRGASSGWYWTSYQQYLGSPPVLTARYATYSWTGVNGNQSADWGSGGSNGWTHMDSQNGISQPVTNGSGDFKTGRLTFPYDAQDPSVGTIGNVALLGQNNSIDAVSGHVGGHFSFDGRSGDGNQSVLYNLGDFANTPLNVGGNLLVHSRSYLSIDNGSAGGSAVVLADSSLYCYSDFHAASIEFSAASDIGLYGSLTAVAGDVVVAAGHDLTLASGIAVGGTNIDLLAGRPYSYDGGEGNPQTTSTGGNLTLNSGSSVTADNRLWLQASSGYDHPGDILQEVNSTVGSGAGNVFIVADRDISLAGALSASIADGGEGGRVFPSGDLIVAAGRDLTLSGSVTADSYIDLEAGVRFDAEIYESGSGNAWSASSSGGNILLTATSSAVSATDLWIGAEGVAEGRVGSVTQQSGSTIEASQYVDIYAWDALTLSSVTVAYGGEIALGAGYSDLRDFNPTAKNLRLGLVHAAGAEVSATASGGILDDNGVGLTNITAANVYLTTYGGGIDSDITGASSISAEVSSSALNGGIRIGSSGTAPHWIGLYDDSTYGGPLSYVHVGNVDDSSTINAETNHGDILIAATGNLADGGEGNVWYARTPDVALVSAGGDLTVDYALRNPAGQLGLTAGGTLNIGGEVAGTYGVALIAPAINLNGGRVSSYSGSIGFITGRFDAADGGYLQTWSETGDIIGLATGDIGLADGAHFRAGNDIRLTLAGTASTLSLSTGSYLLANSPDTIHLAFTGRSSGGVLVNGTESTGNSGDTGFFVGNPPTPATPGAGLEISYSLEEQALTLHSVINDLNDAWTKGTLDRPTDSDEEKRPERDSEDADESKNGKNDDKPGRKKVAQCS